MGLLYVTVCSVLLYDLLIRCDHTRCSVIPVFHRQWCGYGIHFCTKGVRFSFAMPLPSSCTTRMISLQKTTLFQYSTNWEVCAKRLLMSRDSLRWAENHLSFFPEKSSSLTEKLVPLPLPPPPLLTSHLFHSFPSPLSFCSTLLCFLDCLQRNH